MELLSINLPPFRLTVSARISLSNTNSPRRPKSILFGRSSVRSSPSRAGECEAPLSKIQATGTMREAFPPSLPSGSPDLEKITSRKLIGQQSVPQLDASSKTNATAAASVTAAGPSPKKDSTDSPTAATKSKKTTTKIGGHSPLHHGHRNSSPNTKYFGSGSPTLKSDLKTHPERGKFSWLFFFRYTKN